MMMPYPATPNTRPDRTDKNADPETLAEAKNWEKLTRRYQDAGLCRGCAGQAAYGHQLGWTALEVRETEPPYEGLLIDPGNPCEKCAPIVAMFPIDTAHSGWRRMRGRAWSAPTHETLASVARFGSEGAVSSALDLRLGIGYPHQGTA